MILDVTRARKLIGWARPWNRFEAKPLDPEQPSLARLVDELGDQLEAALAEINRLYEEDELPPGMTMEPWQAITEEPA